jgi:hypothetical protein
MASSAKTQEKIADLSTVDRPGSTPALEAFGVKKIFREKPALRLT